MSELVEAYFGTIGFAPDGCAECGCGEKAYHYSGCSFAPYVCPGCHAFDGAPCAPGCIDAEIAAQNESADDDTDYERDDLNGSDDWEREP